MELKYLNTFQTIVGEGSFSKAAEKLSYTQSTITFQIGQLEQALGAKLFEKLGRRMVLTKAGEQLLPYVRDVLGAVEKLQYFACDLDQCQGELRVGVAESLLCYQMPEMLGEFYSRAPKARLFLQSMNCYDIRDALLKGDLDLGLFYDWVGGFGAQLTTMPLGSYPQVLVASPAIGARFGDFTTPDQTIPLPLILNERNSVFRKIFEEYLRQRSIRLDHTIELWSIPTIKKLVQHDMGVSYLPRFTVEEELAQGSLVALAEEVPDRSITAVCGYHKNKWVSPLMTLFMELLHQVAGVLDGNK